MLQIRTLCVLLAAVVLVALGPAASAAKKKRSCTERSEQAGCKLKNAGYRGVQSAGGQTYGINLTIGSSNSTVRGALKAQCSGGNPNTQPPGERYAPLVQIIPLPKTLTVGKTYKKSGHIDEIKDTGQTKVRLVSDETVTVKIVSAKKAKVTISTDTSSQNVEPPSEHPPFRCVGTGTETLKRAY